MINELLLEWMSDLNASVKKWMSEWSKKQIKEQLNEWMNDCKWLNDKWIIKWITVPSSLRKRWTALPISAASCPLSNFWQIVLASSHVTFVSYLL